MQEMGRKEPLWERTRSAMPDLFQEKVEDRLATENSYVRHLAVKRRDASTLDVWFSVRKDVSGEKIYQATVDVAAESWLTWEPFDVVTVLDPEEPWEGSTLLDPYVVTDVDGQAYLFYSGSQKGMGVAKLD